jgi:hypothetical protein
MAIGNKGTLAMSERAYDFAKDAALIYLPAAGTLYAALAGIWGLLYVVQIVGTIAAVDTFLGVVLKISSASYNAHGAGADGILKVTDGLPSGINLELTPDQLAGRTSIVLHVSGGLTPNIPVVAPVSVNQSNIAP